MLNHSYARAISGQDQNKQKNKESDFCLLSIIKTPMQRVETQKGRRRALRRGQLAGTRYPRQAIRGTGLGRGDPSADGASPSGTSGTYVQELPIACLV